jgi:hypothetical protein
MASQMSQMQAVFIYGSIELTRAEKQMAQVGMWFHSLDSSLQSGVYFLLNRRSP